MSTAKELQAMPEKELQTVTDSGSLMAFIGRAASDPNVDVDKLERMMNLYERVTAKNSEQAFNAAMSAAQTEMRPVSADMDNPQTRSRYASYAAIDNKLRPIYTSHGFAVSFDTGDSLLPEMVRVLCYVSHKDGYSRTYKADMPADGKGAKGGDVMTKTHASGAAMQYGMRYLLKMIFNVAVGEDDNDGNGVDTITDEQAANIQALVDEVGANIAAMLKFAQAKSIETIRAKNYEPLIKMLEKKRKQS